MMVKLFHYKVAVLPLFLDKLNFVPTNFEDVPWGLIFKTYLIDCENTKQFFVFFSMFLRIEKEVRPERG